MSKASTTRDRIVNAARELFYDHGYSEASLADILKKAEANSGSLYHFFKSKEELLLAVLELYKAMMQPVLLEPLWKDISDPIDRVWALLGGYRQFLIMTDYTYGCPIGNLALELGNRLPAARQKLHENFENWRLAVKQCLDDARDRLPSDVDRDKLATFVLTTMEGGVMQARTAKSIEPFDSSVEMLKDYFTRLMKTP
ncbi:MAG: TetR family transcriptional regulator C-terminal domain-containing protein [Planctomycetota bacterium]